MIFQSYFSSCFPEDPNASYSRKDIMIEMKTMESSGDVKISQRIFWNFMKNMRCKWINTYDDY